MFNRELLGIDIHAVSDIIRMLYEQKDAGTEDFLSSGREHEGERKESSRRCGQGSTESGSKESNYTWLVCS